MFRFWYRFVPANSSIITRGAADLVFKRIEPHLSDYMGRVFEEICRQYLWKQLLTGESLIYRGRLFHYDHTQIYLFAKSGFTKGCVDAAVRMGNVTLVSYADMPHCLLSN